MNCNNSFLHSCAVFEASPADADCAFLDGIIRDFRGYGCYQSDGRMVSKSLLLVIISTHSSAGRSKNNM